MSVDRLELELAALAHELDLPATPDLVPGVRRRLAQPGRMPRRGLRGRRLVVAVALAVLLPATLALALSSDLRDRVRDWLGVDAVTVEEVETLPIETGGRGPRGGPALIPVSFERSARQQVEPVPGERVPLVTARQAADFPVRVPRGPGRPAVVFLAGEGRTARVSIAWRPTRRLPRIPGTRWGLLVTQLRGDLDGAILKQTLRTGERQFLNVGRWQAFAILGAPHTVRFRDVDGTLRTERTRLAVNTLLISADGLLLRVEADAPLGELVRVGEELVR